MVSTIIEGLPYCDAVLCVFLACADFECPGSDIVTHSAGRVSFSPEADEPHFVDTVATFTCEGGYILLPVGEGGSTRRCEIGGWSGTNPTCSKLHGIQLPPILH